MANIHNKQSSTNTTLEDKEFAGHKIKVKHIKKGKKPIQLKQCFARFVNDIDENVW
jgi:hypothetical protein